jgi:hypothetical protein
MQSHDDNQRPTEGDPDGRRNTEQSPDQNADRLAHTPVPDLAHGTVCLSAGLTGKGGLLA